MRHQWQPVLMYRHMLIQAVLIHCSYHILCTVFPPADLSPEVQEAEWQHCWLPLPISVLSMSLSAAHSSSISPSFHHTLMSHANARLFMHVCRWLLCSHCRDPHQPRAGWAQDSRVATSPLCTNARAQPGGTGEQCHGAGELGGQPHRHCASHVYSDAPRVQPRL